MKAVIIGAGLMGPAAAHILIKDFDVVMCDREEAPLKAAEARFGVRTSVGLSELKGADVALAAVPKPACPEVTRAVLKAGVPLVDLTAPPDEAREALIRETGGGTVVSGCGVEPGLTEIWARHLAAKLDRVDEVHIKCGGIPSKPSGPLGYKIVFGGRRLPLSDRPAGAVTEGRLVDVPRYSAAEPVSFEGVGDCEAWHEGFMPWLCDLPEFKGLKAGTQKTVRWPGYSEKISILRDLGFLSLEPVRVGGVEVAPKHLLDAVLYPHVKLEPDERDITVMRVDVIGDRRLRVDLVDRYDEKLGFTSMARTTAFTGAIIARMVAEGGIGPGFHTPERVITGDLFDRLIQELGGEGVTFAESVL